MAPRETENKAYAKFWVDKQRALWYVMVFLEWSISLPPLIYYCIQTGKKVCTLKLLNYEILTPLNLGYVLETLSNELPQGYM